MKFEGGGKKKKGKKKKKKSPNPLCNFAIGGGEKKVVDNRGFCSKKGKKGSMSAGTARWIEEKTMPPGTPEQQREGYRLLST